MPYPVHPTGTLSGKVKSDKRVCMPGGGGGQVPQPTTARTYGADDVLELARVTLP